MGRIEVVFPKRGSDLSSVTVDLGRPSASMRVSGVLLFTVTYPVAPTVLGNRWVRVSRHLDPH